MTAKTRSETSVTPVFPERIMSFNDPSPREEKVPGFATVADLTCKSVSMFGTYLTLIFTVCKRPHMSHVV